MQFNHFSPCLGFPLGRPFPRMSVSETPKVSLARLMESLLSHPGAPWVEVQEAPHRPPPSLPEGMPDPPTCKHRRAVGIADVGVRGVDVLSIEDEDPQHDWHELGPRVPKGAEKAGEGRGRSRRSWWVSLTGES